MPNSFDASRNCRLRAPVEEVGQLSEGLAAACVSETWGYINKEGEWVIKPSYVSDGNFSEGLAVVKPY
ncbi:hypothetical protein C6495_03570 [Candidatus Poribacteria bacterium]|nr:MAG: hypothetical protein C6495_03570 [Candidatus Poribacteria bacterium]